MSDNMSFNPSLNDDMIIENEGNRVWIRIQELGETDNYVRATIKSDGTEWIGTTDDLIQPIIEDLEKTASRTFPTEILRECNTATAFFSAAFYGTNDVIHLYINGLNEVTINDIHEGKMYVMEQAYPSSWSFITGDAFDLAKEQNDNGKLFDIVIVDPFSNLAPRVFDEFFELFFSLSKRYFVLTIMYQMFVDLDVEPTDITKFSKVVSEKFNQDINCIEILQRSTHLGGAYWAVFEK